MERRIMLISYPRGVFTTVGEMALCTPSASSGMMPTTGSAYDSHATRILSERFATVSLFFEMTLHTVPAQDTTSTVASGKSGWESVYAAPALCMGSISPPPW